MNCLQKWWLCYIYIEEPYIRMYFDHSNHLIRRCLKIQISHELSKLKRSTDNLLSPLLAPLLYDSFEQNSFIIDECTRLPSL